MLGLMGRGRLLGVLGRDSIDDFVFSVIESDFPPFSECPQWPKHLQ